MFSGLRTIDNNIFDQFNLIQRELESAFNKNVKRVSHTSRIASMYPPVNIFSTNEYFQIELFASNLKTDAIDITVDKNILTIKSERELYGLENARTLLKERVDGKVSRQVTLPEESDSENITADYKLGVLTIKIAKREKAQPIKVNVH